MRIKKGLSSLVIVAQLASSQVRASEETDLEVTEESSEGLTNGEISGIAASVIVPVAGLTILSGVVVALAYFGTKGNKAAEGEKPGDGVPAAPAPAPAPAAPAAPAAPKTEAEAELEAANTIAKTIAENEKFVPVNHGKLMGGWDALVSNAGTGYLMKMLRDVLPNHASTKALVAKIQGYNKVNWVAVDPDGASAQSIILKALLDKYNSVRTVKGEPVKNNATHGKNAYKQLEALKAAKDSIVVGGN